MSITIESLREDFFVRVTGVDPVAGLDEALFATLRYHRLMPRTTIGYPRIPETPTCAQLHTVAGSADDAASRGASA